MQDLEADRVPRHQAQVVNGRWVQHRGLSYAVYDGYGNVALEALLCIKRAGADAILTYYAKQAASWLRE